jgi:hypothetical protein
MTVKRVPGIKRLCCGFCDKHSLNKQKESTLLSPNMKIMSKIH